MKKKLLIVLILMFYVWTATQGEFTIHLNSSKITSYNYLASAFLKGQVYLPIEVPSELLVLKDPYDPVANFNLRTGNNSLYQDLSLYKGRFYLYYGPSPVVLLYIPFKLFLSRFMPDGLVAFVFLAGSFLFSVLIMGFLKNKYFNSSPKWIELISIAVLGIANLSPFLLRRALMYEVAIACSCFFLIGAIYFICLGMHNKNPKLLLLLTGIFLGLGLGGRLYFVFCEVLLICTILIFMRCKKIKNIDTTSILYLIVPFIFSLIALGYYNYIRFESFFENGFKYQITTQNNKALSIYSIKNVLSNFYFYTIYPPMLSSYFPFVHMKSWIPSSDLIGIYSIVNEFEKIVGIFIGIPFILLLLFTPFIYILFIGKFRTPAIKFPTIESLLILVPAFMNFVLLLFFKFVLIRYVADYITLLILASTILWFYIDTNLSKKPYIRFTIRLLMIFLSVITIILAIAFSIQGPGDILNYCNPSEFRRLEEYFKPISILIEKIIR